MEISLACSFLDTACSYSSIDELIDKAINQCHLDKAALINEKSDIINLLNQMVADFKSEMKDQADTAKLYFGAPDKEGKCESLRDLILLIDYYDFVQLDNIEDLRNALEGLSEEEFLEKYSKVLFNYNNLFIKTENSIPETLDSTTLVRYINKLDLPDKVKLLLNDLYLYRHKHIEQICSLLTDTLKFMKKYQKEVNQQIEKFHRYWNAQIGDRTFHQFLTEDITIFSQLGENPNGYILVPSLNIFNFSLAMPFDESKPTKTVFALGMIFGDVLTLTIATARNTSNFSTQTVVDAMKLIADKSRFEILKFLHGREAYGNEIAEHLGLTTATVSHHMGQLLSAGIVNIDKRNGKLFYSINSDQLKNYFDFYEEKLLG